MNGVRRFRSPLLGVLLLVAVAACTTTDERSARAPEGASEQVKAELVVAAGKDTGRISPDTTFRANIGFGVVNASIFESLLALGSDFTVQPALATRWELRPPDTWRFDLRRGVTFHNGAPFNAGAVVTMVDQMWSKNPSAANLLLAAGSAVRIDDFTVDITPTSPNLRLPEQLVHPLYGIQAPGTYAGDGTSAASTPTGTGPFKFSSYRINEALRVERFDGYWGARPAAQKLTFRFIEKAATRADALRAGEVDAIYDFPREAAGPSAENRDLTIVRSAVGGYDAMLLNVKGPTAPYDLLKDVRVRQAVALAVDKAVIVNNVWQGNAEVMNTLIPASVLGTHASKVKGFPFDRARARRLLDEAGWVAGGDGLRTKAGRPLKLTMILTNADLHAPAHELIPAQLKEVGINVEVVPVENPQEYGDKVAKGEGDIFLEVGNQNDANFAFLGALFTPAKGGFAGYAASFGPGQQYDELFTRAIGSPDAEEVRRLAAEAMHLVVDEVVAAVPIAGIYRIWALRTNVRGFTPHPAAQHQRWSDAYAVL